MRQILGHRGADWGFTVSASPEKARGSAAAESGSCEDDTMAPNPRYPLSLSAHVANGGCGEEKVLLCVGPREKAHASQSGQPSAQ